MDISESDPLFSEKRFGLNRKIETKVNSEWLEKVYYIKSFKEFKKR